MKRKLLRFGHGFHVAIGNTRSQAAQMTLNAGEREGGPDNRHRGADQWMYVVAGEGIAIVNKRRYSLSPGALLLIERGDFHEIRASSNGTLQTLNIYVPPAYADDDSPLSAGKP